MDIQFTGFRDTAGVRHFAFDLIAADRSRSRLVVSADMSLARKYDITLQELPLLCRRLLDEPHGQDRQGPVSLTEQHMAAIRAAVQAGAEKKRRKAPPVSPNTGRAWR
jgi:hypothetical protein